MNEKIPGYVMGYVMGYVPGYVPGYVMGYVPTTYIATFFPDSFFYITKSHSKSSQSTNLIKGFDQTRKLFVVYDRISTIPNGLVLSNPALNSMSIENAGGNSSISEMMSIELYSRIFDATDFLFEMQINYRYEYNMVDYICSIDNKRVGVSVTRAMGYPREYNFDSTSALRLLRKKLHGLIIARNSVNKKQRFFRSVLHIWCQSSRIANLINKAYKSFDVDDYGLDIKGYLILHLTVCSDDYIYNNTFTFN